MPGWLRSLLAGGAPSGGGAGRGAARGAVTPDAVAATIEQALDHFRTERRFTGALAGIDGFVPDGADQGLPGHAMDPARGISASETRSTIVLRLENCPRETALAGAGMALERRRGTAPVSEMHEERGDTGLLAVQGAPVRAASLGIERPVMCHVSDGRLPHLAAWRRGAPPAETVQASRIMGVANAEAALGARPARPQAAERS